MPNVLLYSCTYMYVMLTHTVQLKDVQGHPYTLKNIHVRFSEPQLEPMPDVKLHLLLSDVVKGTVWEGKQPLVHYGSVTTCGKKEEMDRGEGGRKRSLDMCILHTRRK